MAVSAHQQAGLKALLGLESDIDYLQRVAGPRASVMTLNRIRARVRTEVTNKIWKNTSTLTTEKGYGLSRSLTIPVKLKRKHVFKRIFSSKATINRRYSNVSGYVQPIPAISLGETTKRATGRSITKGTNIKAKIPGKRAKNQTPRPYGVKIGGTTIPGAFLQIVSKGIRPHLFMRDTAKTWNPGYSGWNFPPGSHQRHARAPYGVIKFRLREPFEKYFEPTVRETVEEHWVEEYDRALGVAAGRILANTSK